MSPITGVGPQLARAANGTDPRGVLAFEYLPAGLQNTEDTTQAADFERAKRGVGTWYREIAKLDIVEARDDAAAAGVPRLRWLARGVFLRDATPTERALLEHLGHTELPELLYTRVAFPSPGVRNRRWPQLPIENPFTTGEQP